MPEHVFEIVVALCAGIGLAAAAGIRAFLPLLAVSIGSRLGLIDLNPGLEFLSTDLALIALIVATLLEIGSDKVPVVDNMLDVVSTFLRPIAGFVAAMAMFGDLPQPIAIAVALVMAVVSLGTQVGRAKARLGSTATTGGLANPLLSTAEDAVSGTLSFLAIVLPILAGVAVLVMLWILWKVARSVHRVSVRRFGTAARSGRGTRDPMEITPEP
ncbi:MAG: DUF4126 domain-containing protein [Candidatus Eisenbacteria bacterium]|nr:DUF4126 domain-containing protein [Candidatus Eisenbacteria bacterium]